MGTPRLRAAMRFAVSRAAAAALAGLAAIAGAAFATRQVLLHIMPGDPGYGSAIFGFHYYTWAVIGFCVAIVAIAAILLFDRQFKADDTPRPAKAGAFAQAAIWLVIALTAANVMSTMAVKPLAKVVMLPPSLEIRNTDAVPRKNGKPVSWLT